MAYRSPLAILPALLFLTYACGTKVVESGVSSLSSSGAGSGGSHPASSVVVGPATAGSSTSTGGVGTGSAGGGPATCGSSFVTAPITLLPNRVGNLDLAGPDDMGLTLPEANQIDCPCTPLVTETGGSGGAGASVQGICAWGASQEMWTSYSFSTQIIQSATLWPGYLGTLDFESRDGAHTYSIPVQTGPILKDGAPFLLDWDLPGFNENAAFDAEVNELYDGLTATYAPGLPTDPSCQGSGACKVGNLGDVAYMLFAPFGVTFWVASLSAGQPTCSIFNRVDVLAPPPAP
jgi:hypothetical protein